MAAALDVMKTPGIFRDMSGLEHLRSLLETLTEAAVEAQKTSGGAGGAGSRGGKSGQSTTGETPDARESGGAKPSGSQTHPEQAKPSESTDAGAAKPTDGEISTPKGEDPAPRREMQPRPKPMPQRPTVERPSNVTVQIQFDTSPAGIRMPNYTKAYFRFTQAKLEDKSYEKDVWRSESLVILRGVQIVSDGLLFVNGWSDPPGRNFHIEFDGKSAPFTYKPGKQLYRFKVEFLASEETIKIGDGTKRGGSQGAHSEAELSASGTVLQVTGGSRFGAGSNVELTTEILADRTVERHVWYLTNQIKVTPLD